MRDFALSYGALIAVISANVLTYWWVKSRVMNRKSSPVLFGAVAAAFIVAVPYHFMVARQSASYRDPGSELTEFFASVLGLLVMSVVATYLGRRFGKQDQERADHPA